MNNYSQEDHMHCWQSKKPPCGQRVEHLKCCLCERLNPKTNSVKAAIKYAAMQFQEGRTAAIKEVVEIADKLIRENDDVGVDRLEKGYDMGLSDLKQSITSLIERQ